MYNENIACQRQTLKRSDKLSSVVWCCTFDFLSAWRKLTNAWGIGDIVSSASVSLTPTHSTEITLMTFFSLPFHICSIPAALNPPLFWSILAVLSPRLFPPQWRWLNTPPSHSQMARAHTHPEGKPDRSAAREPSHLPFRLPTSACFSILPLGLQHWHGSLCLLYPVRITICVGEGEGKPTNNKAAHRHR